MSSFTFVSSLICGRVFIYICAYRISVFYILSFVSYNCRVTVNGNTQNCAWVTCANQQIQYKYIASMRRSLGDV